MSSAAAGSIASDTLVHSLDTRVAAEPTRFLTGAYLAHGRLAIRRGREEQRFEPGDAVLYPYGAGFEVGWDTLDQTLVRLSFSDIARLAAQTTGADAATFRFLGMRPVSAEMGRYWCTVMVYVHREFAAQRPALSHPLVLAQTEYMLATAALSVFPHTGLSAARGPGVGRVGSVTLRRAVAFIDTHAGEAITVADVAAETGVGVRALQQAFAGHLDTTPTDYLRRVRLERAHRDLQAADPTRGGTVGEIALRWGFAKRSRFAAAYRGAYGVSPSQTLRS
jgi:AraC-like DNA-binding protein